MHPHRYVDYNNWHTVADIPDQTSFIFYDHLNGFDALYQNQVFDLLQKKYNSIDVCYHNILDQRIHDNYPNLNLKFSASLQEKMNFDFYDVPAKLKKIPENFNNFICSFNGSAHISRVLLASALHKFGWFRGSTKNFTIDTAMIDGFVRRTSHNVERVYRKFLISDDETFNRSIINLAGYDQEIRFDHRWNIPNLEYYLKSSFLHIISETMATTYQPFVTEKLLYPILTKSLWLAYAAPNYHAHLEKYYGFRKFTIFDYSFDEEPNPIFRLVDLLSSLAKFSNLTQFEWHDLYLMEQHIYEFNFDHYMSKSFLKVLRQFE